MLDAAAEGELVVAGVPGYLVARVIDHRVLPADPSERLTIDVQRQDQRTSRRVGVRAMFNEDHPGLPL